MQPKGQTGSKAWALGGGAVLCLGLVWSGLTWPGLFHVAGPTSDATLVQNTHSPPPLHPFLEVLKLISAAAMGLVVTLVHSRRQRDKPMSRALEQAQILLCVSGALMMIIIGNSFARAIGVAGGAGIIRFRTPVKDPKDSTILFLLLGVGMACGLGAFAVAGLGTAFLCMILLVLDYVGERKLRSMRLEVTAAGGESPAQHVEEVLARHGADFEPLEFSQGVEAVVKYKVKLNPALAMSELTAGLMSPAIKSVKWEKAKKAK